MNRTFVTVAALAVSLAVLFWPGTAEAAGHGTVARSAIGAHQKNRSRAEREEADFHVTGEVSRGKGFQQDVGHGVVFELVPPSNAPDAGWVIEVVPKGPSDDDSIEFSSIATPPYHVYNDRILATAYGRSAHEIVGLKDRTFFFVRSAEDEHRAEEVVNAAFYPTDLSDQDRVRVASEEHQIEVSKGELHILKSHTTRSQTLGGPGTIEWIRFELEINFSPGVTMADVIARVAKPQ